MCAQCTSQLEMDRAGLRSAESASPALSPGSNSIFNGKDR